MSQYTPRELAIHAVLRDWFGAMEDGSVVYRIPESGYERPEGKQPWTEDQLADLMRVIDDYVWQQRAWAENAHKKAYDSGPGFNRLTTVQRVAFAQDLERALTTHPKVTVERGAYF